MKTIAINGSLRKGGNTHILVEKALTYNYECQQIAHGIPGVRRKKSSFYELGAYLFSGMT
jgi:hypothetical protein